VITAGIEPWSRSRSPTPPSRSRTASCPCRRVAPLRPGLACRVASV